MSFALTDRLEMRVSPQLKERVRLAAEAQGTSLTRFAIRALTEAANDVLDKAGGGRLELGWAAGTAREVGDILAPATDLDAWEVLRE